MRGYARGSGRCCALRAPRLPTVARLLARLGLTPQRPVRRAFTRDDEACRRWAETEFPAVVRPRRRPRATTPRNPGEKPDGRTLAGRQGTRWPCRRARSAAKSFWKPT